jgi:hypothetical protein
LDTRGKPQAFAADAVSRWILNRSLLIINELALYDAKPIMGTFRAHAVSVWHNSASAAPAASFLWAIRKFRFRRFGVISSWAVRTGRWLLSTSARPIGEREDKVDQAGIEEYVDSAGHRTGRCRADSTSPAKAVTSFAVTATM